MAIRKFDGYKGLFTEFWGFRLQELHDMCGRSVGQLEQELGPFWDQPVVMVDDVHAPWLLVGHTGKDLAMNEAHGFKCVDLVAESFTSRLFLASDVDALVARSFGSADQYHFVQEGV